MPWTKPADIVYDAKSPLPKLSGVFENGFHILLADGSVRLVPRNINETVLRRAIVRNDGVGFEEPKPKE